MKSKYCNHCGQMIRERKDQTAKRIGVMPIRGAKGIRYKAQLWFDGTTRGIGTYATEEEAYQAYLFSRDMSNKYGRFIRNANSIDNQD